MKEKFEKDMNQWIEEEILVPYNDKVEGIIQLIAFKQPKKDKVRPLPDFRELNHIKDFTLNPI